MSQPFPPAGSRGSEGRATEIGPITERLRSLATDLHALAATRTDPAGDAGTISEVAARMQELAARLDEEGGGPLDESSARGSDVDPGHAGEAPSPDPANFGPGDASGGPQPVGLDASPEGDHPGR